MGKKQRLKLKNYGVIHKSFKFLGKSAIWCVIILLFNSLAATCLAIISPLLLTKITNELNNKTGITSSSLKIIINTSIIILSFYIAKFVLSDLPYGIIKNWFDQKSGDKFRKELFKKIGKLPLSYFDNTSVGKNMTVIVYDTGSISGDFIGSICQVFTSIVYFFGLITVMFITQWQMALFCMFAIPVFGTLLPLILTKSKKLYSIRRDTYGDVNKNIEEMFSNTLLIRAANKETEAQLYFNKLINSLYKISKKSQFISSLSGPMFSITNNLMLISIVIFATITYSINRDTGGPIASVPSFILFIGMFNSPFTMISNNTQRLLNVSVCLERIFFVLEHEEVSPETPFSQVPKNNDIDFEHVSFGYTEKVIIDDFNLHVDAGKTVAIVGETGSGKSTIVNLLMRFYEINKGSIKIGGVNIQDINRETLRAMFSMVLQEPWIFTGTIKENIIYNSPNISNDKLREICEKINILHFIETLPKGFDTMVNDSFNISTGEKQLLTIARLLVKNTPFIILDEATANVDTQTEQRIQHAMNELTSHKTTFIIAHRLSTIKSADLIVVINNGKIIEQGNHDELLKLNKEYSKLYYSQFKSCE